MRCRAALQLFCLALYRAYFSAADSATGCAAVGGAAAGGVEGAPVGASMSLDIATAGEATGSSTATVEPIRVRKLVAW